MVATGKVLAEVYFGENGVAAGGSNKVPRIFVDCSSIGVDESAGFRRRLGELGAHYVAAPVSGNGKCVKAGKLSAVLSGSQEACETVKPYVGVFAKAGVSYVGEGERARICKIAHNVMLGVVIQSLAEITVLAQKHGVPRHAFLDFMNNSVLGSTFTRYKSNALVNLDWTTTFTPELLRKDLDLGLAAGRNAGRRDAARRGDPRGPASAFRRRISEERSASLYRGGFRGLDRDRGARRGHPAGERACAGPDGARN